MTGRAGPNASDSALDPRRLISQATCSPALERSNVSGPGHAVVCHNGDRWRSFHYCCRQGENKGITWQARVHESTGKLSTHHRHAMHCSKMACCLKGNLCRPGSAHSSPAAVQEKGQPQAAPARQAAIAVAWLAQVLVPRQPSCWPSCLYIQQIAPSVTPRHLGRHRGLSSLPTVLILLEG